MRKLRNSIIAFIICLIPFLGQAQELNCRVTVNAQKITGKEAKIFATLETSIREFMNSRSWTQDKFSVEEQIECSIFITLEADLGNDQYTATMAVQSSRPIYNTSLQSTMFNFIDNDVVFEYREFQPLEFSDNTYISNLTSILGFYAYFIIGLDYDSFSKKGGTTYFEKAENVMNQVPPTGGAKGWKPFDGQRNRYWLITNILNNAYGDFRDAWYDYHLNGMDKLYEDIETGRKNIYEAVLKFKSVAENNPNSLTINTFVDAKGNEITDIFSESNQKDKSEIFKALIKMDPTKTTVFQKRLFKK